jgi:isoleucyl-tRNA synthetase
MLAKADVSKALEEARSAKIIGKSLGAKVEIFAEGSYYELLKEIESDLITYFITSGAHVLPLDEAPENALVGETGIKVLVSVADGEECERCWIHSESVGKDATHPTLCARCASVLKEGN